MNPLKHFRTAALCLGALTLAVQTHAANVFWTNPGTGNWSDGANWNNTNAPGTIPAAADVPFINNGGTVIIDSTQTILAGTTVLAATNGNTGYLNITGGSLTTSSDIRIGNNVAVTGGTSGGNGIITQSGGAITLNGGNMNLGYGDSAVGTYNLSSGTLALATASGGIFAVGNRGSGIVNQTGGSVYIRNSTGAGQINLGRNSAFNVNNSPGKSSGEYNLSGGDVTVNALRYGNVNNTIAGSINTFNLSGTGSLTVSNIAIVNAGATNSFNFTGGNLTAITSGMSLTNNGGTLNVATLVFGTTGNVPATAAQVTTSLIGTMTFQGTTGYKQESTGTLAIDILNGSGFGTGNDFVKIGSGGSAIIAGTISLNLLNGYDPTLGSTFDILTAGLITDNAIIAGITPSGYGFDSSVISGGTGGQLLRLTVVPEPGTYALFGLGALTFIFRNRLMRRRIA